MRLRPRPALYRPGWIAALNKGSRCVFCWWLLALPRCAGCSWPHRRAGSSCSPLSAVRPASRASMAGPRPILALSTPRRQGHARRGRAVHARLLEDLDAGFQRGAQFLPRVVTRYGQWIHRTAPMNFREEPFSASVTRPECGESAYSHVTGQPECFREEAAPGLSPYLRAAYSLVARPSDLQRGRITRIWPLPARRLARPIAGGAGLGAGWGSPGGRRSR
jgi:hypothetical protein